jgi:hypothetical protein
MYIAIIIAALFLGYYLFKFLFNLYLDLRYEGLKGLINKYKSKIDGSEKIKLLEEEKIKLEREEIKAKERAKRLEQLNSFKEDIIDGDSYCKFLDKKYILKVLETGFELTIFDSTGNLILKHNYFNYNNNSKCDSLSTILDGNNKELSKNKIIKYFKSYIEEPWGQDLYKKKISEKSKHLKINRSYDPLFDESYHRRYTIINGLNFICYYKYKNMIDKYVDIVATDITYENFVKEREKENKEREEKRFQLLNEISKLK